MPDQERLAARPAPQDAAVEQLKPIQAAAAKDDQAAWRHRTTKVAERVDALHVRLLQAARLVDGQRVEVALLPREAVEAGERPPPLLPRKPEVRQLVDVDVGLRVPELQPNAPKLPPRQDAPVRLLKDGLPVPLPLEPREAVDRRTPAADELLLRKELPQPQQKEVAPPLKVREKKLSKDAQASQLQKVQPLEPLEERPPMHVKVPAGASVCPQEAPAPRLLHQKEVSPPPEKELAAEVRARKVEPVAKKAPVQPLDALPLPNRADKDQRRRLQLHQHPLLRPLALLLPTLLPLLGGGAQPEAEQPKA